MTKIFKSNRMRGFASFVIVLALALGMVAVFAGNFSSVFASHTPVDPSIVVDEISDDFGNSYISPFPTFDCDANPLYGEVTISGSGVGSAPPGLVEQYGVQVDWGDGVEEEVSSTF